MGKTLPLPDGLVYPGRQHFNIQVTSERTGIAIDTLKLWYNNWKKVGGNVRPGVLPGYPTTTEVMIDPLDVYKALTTQVIRSLRKKGYPVPDLANKIASYRGCPHCGTELDLTQHWITDGERLEWSLKCPQCGLPLHGQTEVTVEHRITVDLKVLQKMAGR